MKWFGGAGGASDPIKSVDVVIRTEKKWRVVSGQTISFTANLQMDGDALIADFDGTIDKALSRVREMIHAQVTT